MPALCFLKIAGQKATKMQVRPASHAISITYCITTSSISRRNPGFWHSEEQVRPIMILDLSFSDGCQYINCCIGHRKCSSGNVLFNLRHSQKILNSADTKS